MMRLATLTLTLTLTLAVTSASAHADVAKLSSAELKEITSSSCPYWSPTGPSVICLEAAETVPGVVVTAVVAKASARKAIELIDVANNNLRTLPRGLTALNRELRKGYVPATAVFSTGSDPARVTIEADLTVGVDGGAVTLRRGAQELERLAPTIADGHTLVAEVTSLGGHHLAVIASSAYDENERGPAVIAIWKLPTGYGCPERIQCAPHHAQVRALLDEVCRDAFDAGRYQHVATAVNDGELVADDLRYLFNAYGAFHGYAFKKLRYLNDFFYDADAAAWLPQPCLAKVRSLASERALSAAQASMQVKLRQLWKQASAD